MKIKATGLLLAVSVLLTLAAVPAAAVGDNHAGVFNGTAKISKLGQCNEQTGEASGQEDGGGLGLPIPPHDQKNRLVWSIDAGTVVDVPGGPGTARLCGTLNSIKVDGQTVVGASCVTTKGFNGGGRVELQGVGPVPANTLTVNDLTWKAALGGTFVAYGDVVDDTKANGEDLLIAVVQATPDQGTPTSCTDKNLNGKQGYQDLDIVAAYTVVGGQGNVSPEKDTSGKKS